MRLENQQIYFNRVKQIPQELAHFISILTLRKPIFNIISLGRKIDLRNFIFFQSIADLSIF